MTRMAWWRAGRGGGEGDEDDEADLGAEGEEAVEGEKMGEEDMKNEEGVEGVKEDEEGEGHTRRFLAWREATASRGWRGSALSKATGPLFSLDFIHSHSCIYLVIHLSSFIPLRGGGRAFECKRR